MIRRTFLKGAAAVSFSLMVSPALTAFAKDSVRVYVSGDNLVTFSGISGVFDPELLGSDWGDGKLYPLQRTISIGLNVNF